MKTRILSFLLSLMLLCGLSVSGSAAEFHVTCYYEEIYAGGISDMYAFVDDPHAQGYTYQWQVDLGIGDGRWSNLEDNGRYVGTKTDHMQLITTPGDYSDFSVIPFRCVVTHPDGTVRYTPNMYANIFSTDNLMPNMQKWGYELYEPTLTNATNLKTTDYANYTASAYSGSNLTIITGSKALTDRAVLVNSEVEMTRQILITENGHTTSVTDQTSYTPYTVGTNAVTIQLKLHATIGGHELGDVDTKTIKLSTAKPTVTGTATAKSACSLLRYTYNESQKLASIPKGATVEILGKTGSYYQVFYNNYVGYVGASLLNVSQPSYDPVIKTVDVVIDKPVAGKTPSFTCQVITGSCELYNTEPITWVDKTTGKFLTAKDTFQQGRSYTLQIWLSAKSGYKFQTDASGNPKLTGSINGDLPPFIHKAYEQDPEKVIELSYEFHNTPGAPVHECAPVLVPEVPATCTQNGKQKYYHCGCGKNYSDANGINEINAANWGILPATGHSPGEWRYNMAEHYRYCKNCSEMLDTEDHYGGTATCTQKPKCTVCSFAYGAVAPDHKWSPTYLYKDAKGHAWICADCKTHSEVEPHNPGPAATQTQPQICKDCDYIIAPAKNHTHTLTRVAAKEATCTEDGNLEYYTCSGCSDWFQDAGGQKKLTEKTAVILKALGHFSDTWGYSDTQHWGICRVCNAVVEDSRAPHEAPNAEGCCEICGYVQGMEITEPTEATTETTRSTEMAESTAATEPPETTGSTPQMQAKPNASDTGIPPWVLYLTTGLVCLLLSAAVTMLVIKKMKK